MDSLDSYTRGAMTWRVIRPDRCHNNRLTLIPGSDASVLTSEQPVFSRAASHREVIKDMILAVSCVDAPLGGHIRSLE